MNWGNKIHTSNDLSIGNAHSKASNTNPNPHNRTVRVIRVIRVTRAMDPRSTTRGAREETDYFHLEDQGIWDSTMHFPDRVTMSIAVNLTKLSPAVTLCTMWLFSKSSNFHNSTNIGHWLLFLLTEKRIRDTWSINSSDQQWWRRSLQLSSQIIRYLHVRTYRILPSHVSKMLTDNGRLKAYCTYLTYAKLWKSQEVTLHNILFCKYSRE